MRSALLTALTRQPEGPLGEYERLLNSVGEHTGLACIHQREGMEECEPASWTPS